MPLSQQLKSDMTGVPAETPVTSTPEAPTADPANTFTPDAAETPEVSPAAQAAPGTAEQQSDPPDPIETQLKLLNQNILALERAVNEGKSIDFSSIFSKIDAARASIEALLAPSPADSDTEKLLTCLQTLLEKQEKNDRQLTQTLRENAAFQVQVRQGMQKDLDTLKEQMSGEQFDPLLREVAAVYVEYQALLEDESISGRSRQNLRALFEQLADLLTDHDAEIRRSEVGSPRQTRTCKIIDKLPTGDQAKHNTIAASRKPGVIRGRSVLYPEFVDVFIYDPSLAVSADDADGGEAPLPEQFTEKADLENHVGGIES